MTMGKYLSILKDSLREAIDTKVLYATLAVSCLVVLLVGSTTFEPIPVERQFRRAARLLTALTAINPKEKGTRHDVESFEESAAAGRPWEGQYHFDYVITL